MSSSKRPDPVLYETLRHEELLRVVKQAATDVLRLLDEHDDDKFFGGKLSRMSRDVARLTEVAMTAKYETVHFRNRGTGTGSIHNFLRNDGVRQRFEISSGLTEPLVWLRFLKEKRALIAVKINFLRTPQSRFTHEANLALRAADTTISYWYQQPKKFKIRHKKAGNKTQSSREFTLAEPYELPYYNPY